MESGFFVRFEPRIKVRSIICGRVKILVKFGTPESVILGIFVAVSNLFMFLTLFLWGPGGIRTQIQGQYQITNTLIKTVFATHNKSNLIIYFYNECCFQNFIFIGKINFLSVLLSEKKCFILVSKFEFKKQVKYNI